jgi:colanic acid biosynthesis glycosyl transferase WcaI
MPRSAALCIAARPAASIFRRPWWKSAGTRDPPPGRAGTGGVDSVRIVIVANYYYPEEVGAGIWIRQLAVDLKQSGHEVLVLTSFPSYPAGVIFPSYRHRIFAREQIDGITVLRTYTFGTTSKSFWPRVLSFGAFCVSSALQGSWLTMTGKLKADVVYAILPPLPLGVSGWTIAALTRAKLVTNIQDIYPDIAVETGFLKSPAAIRWFSRMERWIYKHSARIVVISEGFRDNLLAKGVPAEKVSVVSNWADAKSIVLAPRETAFRRAWNSEDRFLVLYAGSLSMNSCLEPVVEAAALLPRESYQFIFAGEGVRKDYLTQRARDLGLTNVEFLPFQPLERYGELLASADATLVTLSQAATHASVPSKIFKQMAAGRPIVAITNRGNELDRLIATSRAGVVVAPDDPAALASAISHLAMDRAVCEEMGYRGRIYVEMECSREKCVAKIEAVLTST